MALVKRRSQDEIESSPRKSAWREKARQADALKQRESLRHAPLRHTLNVRQTQLRRLLLASDRRAVIAPRESCQMFYRRLHSCRRFCRRLPPAGGRFATMANANNAQLLEEQTLLRYAHKRYFPVRIGDRVGDCYRIITKLGFGAYSTVWLAWNERLVRFTNTYASVKIFVHDDSATSPVLNEIKILGHSNSCPREHDGSSIARLPCDFFQLDGPTGRHHCTVSKPQGCSLWDLRHLFPNDQLPEVFVWAAIRCLLGCINWLYLDCNLIHTEITTQNVLTQAANTNQFAAMEREEMLSPSVPVMDKGYPVYQSRGRPRSIRDLTGVAYLTDFGSARVASEPQTDWWMADTYRAPEVLMGVPWGCQVDVWSIGIMALELLEGRNLFEPIDKVKQQYVLPEAIAQYISVLGQPPLWMIQESGNPFVPTFFDVEGRSCLKLKEAEPVANSTRTMECRSSVPKFSLEDWITAIPAGEGKDRFIRFIRKVLLWDPMQRATSSDLFLESVDYKE